MMEAPNEGPPNLTQKGILAPTAFNLNTSNALCLPVFSNDQKLMWIHSNELSLPPDSVAELDKAFNSSPYLTQKKMEKLAQTSSLHPDQVKVWFMVQRLRYGISWDQEDIQNILSKVLPKKGSGQNSKGSGEVEELKGTKRANEEMTVERVATDELLTTEEQDKEMEDKTYMETKRRRVLMDIQTQTESRTKGKKRRTRLKRGESTFLGKPDLIEDAVKGESDETQQESINWLESSRSKHLEWESGIEKMRAAFLKCQYPGMEGHDWLVRETGIPRRWIVDWFRDMRYHIKHRKPRWMSAEQHSRILASIMHKQCKAGQEASEGPNK